MKHALARLRPFAAGVVVATALLGIGGPAHAAPEGSESSTTTPPSPAAPNPAEPTEADPSVADPSDPTPGHVPPTDVAPPADSAAPPPGAADLPDLALEDAPGATEEIQPGTLPNPVDPQVYQEATPQVLETPKAPATQSTWVCWGDSLSYHLCNSSRTTDDVYYKPDGSQSFMQAAARKTDPNAEIINRGVGSETSTEIALRQGALKAYVTVQNNTIPESGSVLVWLNEPSGDFLVFTVHGTLNGVPGVLKRHMVGPGYWTFTRSEAGPAVWVPPVSQFHIPQGDNGVRDLPAIFWVGRNNPGSVDIIKRDIAAMVANRDQSQPYFVVSLTPGFNEWNDTTLGQKRGALNDYLAKTYGARFIDLEAYLQDKALFDHGIWPSAEDRTARAKGGNPRTLWAAHNDQVHYNYLGREIIAKHLWTVISSPHDPGLRNYAPQGDLAAQVGADGQVRVLGWAFDPSDPYASLKIDVTVNGKLLKSGVPATLPSDYLYAYGVPGQHAFIAGWPAHGTGAQEICVTAQNIYNGSDTQLGCRTVQVQSIAQPVSPQGDLAIADGGNGAIAVMGWAFDHSNLYGQISVRVTVNGKPAGTTPANLPSDYLYAYGVPGGHAFFSAAWADNGTNVVCATAVNVGPGADTDLGCQTIEVWVPPQDPMGDVQFGMTSSGRITVNGWAADLSAPVSPVTVVLTLDGATIGYMSANQPRYDLAAYGIPGWHGFSGTIAPPKSGSFEMCAYGANLGTRGAMQQLGCSTLSTANYHPMGDIAVNRLPGGLNISGWLIDFSAPQQPVTVSVYVDGQLMYAGAANGYRYELTTLFGWPPNHGIDLSVWAGAGTHRVDVIAINLGRGDAQSFYSGYITL